jgi:hypothetical protein
VEQGCEGWEKDVEDGRKGDEEEKGGRKRVEKVSEATGKGERWWTNREGPEDVGNTLEVWRERERATAGWQRRRKREGREKRGEKKSASSKK